MIPLPPWLWKVGAGAAIVVGLYAGHKLTVNAAYDKGRAAAIAERAAADLGAVVGRVQENAVAASLQTKINLDLTKAHDEKNKALRSDYSTARNDGLRISAVAITSRLAATTTTKGAANLDDSTSYKLSTETEKRLFDLASEADECSSRLISLQSWIIEQGIY